MSIHFELVYIRFLVFVNGLPYYEVQNVYIRLNRVSDRVWINVVVYHMETQVNDRLCIWCYEKQGRESILQCRVQADADSDWWKERAMQTESIETRRRFDLPLFLHHTQRPRLLTGDCCCLVELEVSKQEATREKKHKQKNLKAIKELICSKIN